MSDSADIAAPGDANLPIKAARGPKGLPILGHSLEMSRDTLGYLEKVAAEYGEVTKLQLGKWPALLLNDSDLTEEVLVKKHEHFIKNQFFWRQLKALMGNGMFTAEGANWQRQRRLAAPAFATRPLESYSADMVAIAEKQSRQWQDGAVVDMHREMMNLSVLIAAKTLLDIDMSEKLDDIDEAANWILDEVAARFWRPVSVPDWVPLPGHRRYLRGVKFMDDLVYGVIAAQRSGKAARAGFLGRLMEAVDEDGKPLSDLQLRDEILNMLVAGYETSALTLSWGFHQLGQDRELQARLAAEADKVAGDRPASHEDIPDLKLTEWTVIEMLRLFPPGWGMGREAARDTMIGPYEVKKGTTVILSPWVTHRDARLYEDPNRFWPERWSGDLRRRLPRFGYFPFSGGPRICIGNRFAMMEAMLVLATLMRDWDVERLMDRPVTPLPSATLRPKGGVWVRLHARKAAQ